MNTILVPVLVLLVVVVALRTSRGAGSIVVLVAVARFVVNQSKPIVFSTFLLSQILSPTENHIGRSGLGGGSSSSSTGSSNSGSGGASSGPVIQSSGTNAKPIVFSTSLPSQVVFGAGAALCEPRSADFVAGAASVELEAGNWRLCSATLVRGVSAELDDENWRLCSATLVRGAICGAGR